MQSDLLKTDKQLRAAETSTLSDATKAYREIVRDADDRGDSLTPEESHTILPQVCEGLREHDEILAANKAARDVVVEGGAAICVRRNGKRVPVSNMDAERWGGRCVADPRTLARDDLKQDAGDSAEDIPRAHDRTSAISATACSIVLPPIVLPPSLSRRRSTM